VFEGVAQARELNTSPEIKSQSLCHPHPHTKPKQNLEKEKEVKNEYSKNNIEKKENFKH
jgi:hypothetical protein